MFINTSQLDHQSECNTDNGKHNTDKEKSVQSR